MSRLSREGVKFTQAYACSVCSPTRISLMTGLNSARHRVTNWTLIQNSSSDWKHPTLNMPAWNVNGLSPVAGIKRTVHAKTLPMFLSKAGYRTIHVGKAHFAAKGLPGEMPENLGFDVNIAGHCAGGPGSYYGKNNFSAAFRKGSRLWDIPGLDKFDATYASMIESMDKSLGDILDEVDKLQVQDNTIIVFMTDNWCPQRSRHQQTPQRPQTHPIRRRQPCTNDSKMARRHKSRLAL